jgi:hypothetical protein
MVVGVMGWAKLDDRRHTNPKLRRAGLEAAGLDAYGLTYCSANETDGFMDSSVVEMLAGVRHWKKIVQRLVDEERWTHDDLRDGWWIVHYLEFNPSHESLEAKRTTDRVRKESTRTPKGTFKESEPPRPDPTRPDKTSRRTSAPQDLPITENMHSWAKDRGLTKLDLDRETTKMLDFHRAKGSKFIDWIAAWRTWMNRAGEYHLSLVAPVTPISGARIPPPRKTCGECDAGFIEQDDGTLKQCPCTKATTA